MSALTEYIATLKEGDTFKVCRNDREKSKAFFVVIEVKKTVLRCKRKDFPNSCAIGFNKKTGEHKLKYWPLVYTIIPPKEFVEKFM